MTPCLPYRYLTTLTRCDCVQGTLASFPGNYGRVCAAPHVCIKGKTTSFTKPCKCLDSANCQSCEYSERGYTCHKCRKSKFLTESGECATGCAAGLTQYGVSQYGRECRPEFRCAKGVSSDNGSACKCAQSKYVIHQPVALPNLHVDPSGAGVRGCAGARACWVDAEECARARGYMCDFHLVV